VRTKYPPCSFTPCVQTTQAPIHNIAVDHFHGKVEHIGHLITDFFVTYVIFSFPSSWIIEKYGLRFGVLLGALVQALGCGIRAIPDGFFNTELHIPMVFAGQIVASLGQSFFVNPVCYM
jgi:FLVCR family MFS transporter 7